MAVHARGGVFSPYRDRGPASLAELVPPDRRRRNAALFGLSCAMIGALMAWSVEALATWDAETLASWDPSPSGWFALRGRAVESPEPTTTLTEPGVRPRLGRVTGPLRSGRARRPIDAHGD